MQSILFVAPDASRTGAPFLLLHLLRWLRDNARLNFEIVLNRTGPLLPQFAELAPTAVLERPATSLSRIAMDNIRPYRLREVLENLSLRRAVGRDRRALVYSNTLVNGKLLEALPDQLCPVISHVHELEHTIQRYATEARLAYTLQRTTQFIAGSATVARNLVDNHGVAANRIEVVHEFIPIAGLDVAGLLGAGRRIRAELGIAEGSFVVGAAGTVEWRKGYDLFIPLALDVLRAKPARDVHFVWVGSAWDRRVPVEIAHDLQELDLGQRVHFVGQRSNYLEYLAMFDTLCLTSREDPFPLVVLESAALSKPVICFARSGGSPEFVENDCGFVVPYLDVQAMASRVIELVNDKVLREELGRCAQAKVRERHDVAVAAPRIADIIDRSLADRSPRRQQ